MNKDVIRIIVAGGIATIVQRSVGLDAFSVEGFVLFLVVFSLISVLWSMFSKNHESNPQDIEPEDSEESSLEEFNEEKKKNNSEIRRTFLIMFIVLIGIVGFVIHEYNQYEEEIRKNVEAQMEREEQRKQEEFIKQQELLKVQVQKEIEERVKKQSELRPIMSKKLQPLRSDILKQNRLLSEYRDRLFTFKEEASKLGYSYLHDEVYEKIFNYLKTWKELAELQSDIKYELQQFYTIEIDHKKYSYHPKVYVAAESKVITKIDLNREPSRKFDKEYELKYDMNISDSLTVIEDPKNKDQFVLKLFKDIPIYFKKNDILGAKRLFNDINKSVVLYNQLKVQLEGLKYSPEDVKNLYADEFHEKLMKLKKRILNKKTSFSSLNDSFYNYYVGEANKLGFQFEESSDYLAIKKFIDTWGKLDELQKEIAHIVNDEIKNVWINGKEYFYQYEPYIASVTYHQTYLSLVKNGKREQKEKIDFNKEMPNEPIITNYDEKQNKIAVPTKLSEMIFHKDDEELIRKMYAKMIESNHLYRELKEQYNLIKNSSVKK